MAAGIPKATIQTLRVESGGRLSLKSAITSPPLDRQASR